MDRDPAADTEILRTIQRAAQAGERAQAATLAAAARAGGLEHPLLYNVLALKLEEEGRLSQAEALLRHAVRLAPGDTAAHNALGLCLLRLDRPAEALSEFESVLAKDATLPFAHTNRGTALFALGRMRDAEVTFRELLAREDLDPPCRAYATGLLADALDAQDRTADAFAAYSLANQLLRRIHASRFDSRPGALAYARDLVGFLRRADPERWRAAPLPGRRDPPTAHIFILGFPRSGATLLEVVLQGHPQVVSLEANEALIDGIREFMRRPEDLDRLPRASPATLDALRDAYWRRVTHQGADIRGKIFVHKNPLGTLELPLIARLFPKAKILLACRDPRDVVLSCFRNRFRMSAPTYELLTLQGAAAYYDAVMRVLLGCTRILTLNICLVRHEDMVTAFAREMRRVCEFLGIEWAPAMGDFALRTQYREAPPLSTAQLVRGLDTEGIGHWHRYRRHLEPVLPLLTPWVEQFCYDPRALMTDPHPAA